MPALPQSLDLCTGVTFPLLVYERVTSLCRWQMDFQEGNISYCTRGNNVDGCSFKLAAYRVPPVSFSEGQHLAIHVELIESTVTFRVAVQEGL
jgi:hypothetical protein